MMKTPVSCMGIASSLGILLVWLPVAPAFSEGQTSLSLAGTWRVRLDPSDEGLKQNWAAHPLTSGREMALPGTTDLAGLGFALDTNSMLHAATFPVTTRFPGVKEPTRADEHGYLVRRHLYVGPAWYERDVEVSADWAERALLLRLERAMWRTEVWLDGSPIGTCDSLVAEHRYMLGRVTPGRHRLTVRVDNRMVHNLSTVTHAYGPETQSRWNGLVGNLSIEALAPVAVDAVAVFPSPDRLSLRAVVKVSNGSAETTSTRVRLSLLPEEASVPLVETNAGVQVPLGESRHEFTLQLREPARAWDEFDPVRYRLVVVLERDGTASRTNETRFGFRHLERVGKALHLNGRRVFLRGTLDCCVYPRTGHPPMTLAEWEQVLGVIKSYGFNHVRYHTWCPPEAAFEAADRLGLYLQPETPAWVDDWGVSTITHPAGIGRSPEVWDYLTREARRLSEAYGNHPSFLLFALGNEFGEQNTDWSAVNEFVEILKAEDPRRLYTGCTARRHLAADEFWVTHHTGASTRGVGPGHTDWDFAAAADSSPVPLLAHETGQRPVFPNYPELLPKFTGALLPLNYDRFRHALDSSGMSDELPRFVEASARFQGTQYKAEHEAMRRTAGYSGYQLLMLNDFTGQSEALVGILDPFWETKGVISKAEVLKWNAPTVVLARFPRYVWSTDQTFEATVEVAHYGPRDVLDMPLDWALEKRSGEVVARGRQPGLTAVSGANTPLAKLSIPLAPVNEPCALTLRVRFGEAVNDWNLWVFPTSAPAPEPPGFRVTRVLDEAAIEELRRGGKVLLLAHDLKTSHAAKTGFESVYWSAGWWGNVYSSLGVLCDPRHPAFSGFPNDGWSDWVWRDLCAGATTLWLEGAPSTFRPLVQPVPDFHYNALLGQLFEASVGQGALVVCGFDLLTDLERRPAAKQFRRSLFQYLGSETFKPRQPLSLEWVERAFAPSGLARRGAAAKADSEDTANGNVAANAIDGDPRTFWHTRWQPTVDPMPHALVIDLGKERTMKGISVRPRQDQSNGRLAEVEIFGGSIEGSWGTPLASVRMVNTDQVQQVPFSAPVKARWLKLQAKSEVNGNPFAAVAEVELVE